MKRTHTVELWRPETGRTADSPLSRRSWPDAPLASGVGANLHESSGRLVETERGQEPERDYVGFLSPGDLDRAEARPKMGDGLLVQGGEWTEPSHFEVVRVRPGGGGRWDWRVELKVADEEWP